MATFTVGQLLLNDVLPGSHQITSGVNKKQLNTMMTDLARSDPHRYVKVIGDLKRVGDAVTTDEGITVGLDDIEPDYAARDRILEPALTRIRKTRDPEKRRKLIDETQQRLLATTKKHPGQMTPMALSGARGNIPQLMKTVVSPVGVTDDQGRTVPWLISKSYAEGLKGPDTWVAMTEARRNAIDTYTSVAAPGEVSKMLVNNMSDQIITMPDCGTHNGISMAADNPNIIDRYRADTGTLIRPGDLSDSKKRIRVRSPMTCEASGGVCQKCYGLNTKGNNPRLGDNVGMVAAQAMGEPLTQMALNAKHAVRTTESHRATLQGLAGFKQLTEIPQTFFNKATLASRPGKITSIRNAPQGGSYVDVEEAEHYVPPHLQVFAKKGTRVEAGDALSEGLPKPDEVVRYKGLGAGRDYLVKQLQNIYDRQGIPMDQRHLELLAKTDLNYIKMNEADTQLGAVRGDVVDYNRFRKHISKDAIDTKLKDALGQYLGNNILHYTAGTPITPQIAKNLQQEGVTSVPIGKNIPAHEPIMKPITRTPLLHPDWLAKMGHRNLKNVLLEGAAFGDRSDIQGTHPVPAFVFGEEFGQGPHGRY